MQAEIRDKELIGRWRKDPAAFWREAAADIDWVEPPRQIFAPTHSLFTGGLCNACWNAVDRHVMAAHGAQPAIIYESPAAGERRSIAYERLWTETQLLGGILRDFEIAKSERVLLFIPNIPEAVFAILACARIGAVHTAVAADAEAEELAARIDETRPKIILSASCRFVADRALAMKPVLDAAIRRAHHKPQACIVVQRPHVPAVLAAGRDYDWKTLWEEAVNYAKTSDCVPVAASDPLWLLPGGSIRDLGGTMTALALAMKRRFGVQPGDTVWSIADIGTPAGTSSTVYAPLLAACSSILFEGTADPASIRRLVDEFDCRLLFAPPAMLDRIVPSDARTLRSFALDGACPDDDTGLQWALPAPIAMPLGGSARMCCAPSGRRLPD